MPLDGELTDMQVRVLGCLIEKKATTPDQYPLTLNAIRTACNQKTSRHPVVDYSEGEVGHTVRELQGLGLITEVWSARAARYEHNVEKALGILRKEAAVLCLLMLRGPQTASEIRTRSQRIYEFDDTDDVEYVLGRLAEHDPPMAMQLPRQPGQKEQRYAQLLAGEPDPGEMAAAPAPRAVQRSALEERVSQLEADVAWLKEKLGEVSDPAE